jgi:NADH pyrophosphatase NudC (nudix superfamily)
MPFIKPTSSTPEDVRPYLEGVAKNLADRLWGPNGPAWGTTLTELESTVVALRQILAEKLLNLALQRQATDPTERPAEFQNCPSCGAPTEPRDPEPRIVATQGGQAQWNEPEAHCRRCRRAFFPAVQKPGD